MNFKRGDKLELEIVDMAFGGKGIAKMPTEEGNFIFFVPNTIAGQKVEVSIAKKRKRHAECKLWKVLEPSPQEVDVPYQPIAGAPYATLPIEQQLEFKKRSAFELFRRIGKVENIEELFDELVPSPRTWHYRNKMEYAFSAIRYDLDEQEEKDEFGLGFKHRGTWWCVENLDKDSGLFDEQWENNLWRVREFCEKSGLPPWHPPRKEGFFRYLIVRKSYHTNEILTELVTHSKGVKKFDFEGYTALLQEILGDRLAGVIHSTNNDIGDRSRSSAGNDTSRSIWGKEKIEERILDLDFEISMRSFFQPNPATAALLYGKAVEYAGEVEEGKVVLDLFCGTGTISQVMASRSSNIVIGVDLIESAIEDARESAVNNGIDNIHFIAADANKFLYEHPEHIGNIGCVMLDPPRAGIAPKALNRIIELDAPRIVYISCNPATQARDTETLQQAGYRMKKFTLVDQFPHTSHIESVVVFEKVLNN